jgi:hypothetical protein
MTFRVLPKAGSTHNTALHGGPACVLWRCRAALGEEFIFSLYKGLPAAVRGSNNQHNRGAQ